VCLLTAISKRHSINTAPYRHDIYQGFRRITLTRGRQLNRPQFAPDAAASGRDALQVVEDERRRGIMTACRVTDRQTDRQTDDETTLQ